jgi:MFS family permease
VHSISEFGLLLGLAVIVTVTGILTLMTVGWWGSVNFRCSSPPVPLLIQLQFSDRHGRKKMIGIAIVGHLISSLNILFVAKYIQQIPGGYWLLVVDAAITGVLGGKHSIFESEMHLLIHCFAGVVSESAAMYAYISDVSTPEKR